MTIRSEFDPTGHKRLVVTCVDWGTCVSPDPCTQIQLDDVNVCDCGSDTDKPCCELGYKSGAFGNKMPVGSGSCFSPCAPPPCNVEFVPDDPSLPPPKQEGEWIAECAGL